MAAKLLYVAFAGLSAQSREKLRAGGSGDD